MLYVFNKCDKVANFEALKVRASAYQPYVMVDALSKHGLHLLTEYLDHWQNKKTIEQ
jgi:50S ribosomal subunit-associated GTPase HflX